MTIKETAAKFGVKDATVKDWCKKNYIRGMTIDENGEYVIPSSVKRPYTGSRSKGDAIYTSIVIGTLKGFDVNAELYGMSNSEF